MIPWILSIAAPLFVYASLALLIWGLYRERSKLEWLALAPAVATLDKQFGKHRKVWYYAGARTNVEGTPDWTADRWVKSNYQLHLIDSREVRGMRIAFYEMLLQPVDREAR